MTKEEPRIVVDRLWGASKARALADAARRQETLAQKTARNITRGTEKLIERRVDWMIADGLFFWLILLISVLFLIAV